MKYEDSELTKHNEYKSGNKVSKNNEGTKGDDMGEHSRGGHYRGDVGLGPRKERKKALKANVIDIFTQFLSSQDVNILKSLKQIKY